MRSQPFRLFVLGLLLVGLASCTSTPEVPTPASLHPHANVWQDQRGNIHRSGQCRAELARAELSWSRMYDREAKEYAGRDGRGDAADAFAKGDRRFFKAMGSPHYMPGIPDGQLADSLEKEFGRIYLGRVWKPQISLK